MYRTSCRLLFLLLFGSFVVHTPRLAASVAGRTPASFVVDPRTGSATYTIPIRVPPGPRDITPKISLVYNSHTGNGYLGVGWSISGLSSITRCGRTYAQDGTAAPVKLSYADAFCVDGSRLMLTSSENLSTYGQDGTTYQTEIANFANVTAHGTAGNGPSSFTVQGKDALTYQYGLTSVSSGSQVLASGTSTVAMWLLSSVTDRFGNSIKYFYYPQTGSTAPYRIEWALSGAGSTSYNYSILFKYQSNAAVAQSSVYGYVGGTPIESTTLLTTIEVENSALAPIKDYNLAYAYSGVTGRALLAGVTECASGSSNCIAGMSFYYTPSASSSQVPGISTTSQSGLSSAGTPGLTFYAQYDLDGNGRTDLLYYQGGVWYMALQNASGGFATPVSTGVTDPNAVFGDLTGIGQDGILANNGGTFTYYLYNGISFDSTSTSVPVDSAATQYVLADVNGDGLGDIIALYCSTTTGQVSVTARLNSTTNGALGFASTPWTAYSETVSPATYLSAQLFTNSTVNDGRLRFVDFNGDGQQDLALEVSNGASVAAIKTKVRELLSNGAGAAFSAGANITQVYDSPLNIGFANWNDDGCTDLVYSQSVYISGCDGSAPTQLPITPQIVATLDWDGDGRTDLLVVNGTTLGVIPSLGNTPGSLQSTSIPYTGSRSYFVIDADGDGQDDLGFVDTSVAAKPASYYVHNNPGMAPDLLLSLLDGYSNTYTITYTSLTQSDYLNDLTPSPGYKPYLQPLYVVTSAAYPDPTSAGASYSQSFSYRDGWVSLQGRGFTGFGATYVTDSRKGSMELLEYSLIFPVTGMKLADQTSQDNTFSYPIHDQELTSLAMTLDGTGNNQRFFPYISNDTTYEYEVGGPENGQQISTTSTDYTFDTFGNLTGLNRSATDNDSSSPFYNQTWTTSVSRSITGDTSSNWCLSLPTSEQITASSPGTSSVTRTVHYVPDYVNCHQTQRIFEPNNPQYQVTEALGFDSFGNINQDTMTGVAMGSASPASRSTSINWGTTGVKPTQVTDPSGAITKYGYDPNWETMTSMTDANSLMTSWAYGDGFARMTQETRPDGTNTQWSYGNCWGTSNGCPAGPGLVITQTVHNSDSTVQATHYHYFDSSDRSLVDDMQGFASGTYYRSEISYDNLGNVMRRGVPCLLGAPVGTGSCPHATTISYDLRNRPVNVTYEINEGNTSLVSDTIVYEGATTLITDSQSHSLKRYRTPVGTFGGTLDNAGYGQTFTYDGFGSLLSVVDTLGTTLFSASYQYGIDAFAASSSEPDGGSVQSVFDALGEVTQSTDANNHTVNFTYDALSRPLARVEPDLTTTWTWGASATLHNWGQLQNVVAGGYSESDVYDTQGRLSSRQLTTDQAYVETYGYDSNSGLLASLTFPMSTASTRVTLNYGYANGWLASITDAASGTAYWTVNTMDPFGHITQATLGNGVAIGRNYDTVTGRLIGVFSTSGNLIYQTNLYDYVGNLTERQDLIHHMTEDFYYDADYRLDHSLLNSNNNLQLSYDARGNISSRSDVNGGATWNYDPTHIHAVTSTGSGTSYTYDNNGNMLTRNGASINWTSYNYPSGISASGESLQFSYDDARGRYKQIYQGSAGTETSYFVAGNLEKVTLPSGVVDWRHYVFAGSTPVAIISRQSSGTNTVHYVVDDHLGSTTALLSSTGTVSVYENFSATGNGRDPTTWAAPVSATDQATINSISRRGFGFQSALGTPQLGLVEMGGRVEDAITGRFLSPDPTVPDSSDSQSFNRYSYTRNNPLSRIDPTGFDDTGDDTWGGDFGGDCLDCGDSGNGGEVANSPPTGAPSVGPGGAADQGLTDSVAPGDYSLVLIGNEKDMARPGYQSVIAGYSTTLDSVSKLADDMFEVSVTGTRIHTNWNEGGWSGSASYSGTDPSWTNWRRSVLGTTGL
jgi:RHS repeat-associated protein